MTDTPQEKRGPLYSQADRDNLRWFWSRYLRKHTGKLLVVLLMILVQGVVFQQFLSMTENGLRVIFERGTLRELAMVCLAVFVLFAVRGLMSYLVPLVTVRMANQAIFEMRRDMLTHLMKLDLAYFERTKSGEIIQRIVSQTQTLGMFVGLGVARHVRAVVGAGGRARF